MTRLGDGSILPGMVRFLSGVIGLLIMALPVACMWFYKRGREDEREGRPAPTGDEAEDILADIKWRAHHLPPDSKADQPNKADSN